jgi:aspartate racemase
MTEMMDVIYGVKAGGPSAQQALRMRSLMEILQGRGAEVALIACTELSVLASHFPGEGKLAEVDAADVVARRTVTRATPAKCSSIPSRVVSP